MFGEYQAKVVCRPLYMLFDFIFYSISKMTSLKHLDLSYNDLSGDKRLSDKLSELTNLEILDLEVCILEKIPDR